MLWDLATHRAYAAPLEGHQQAVTSIAFSPDSKTLVSGSDDRTLIAWNVDAESWIQQACAIANRNFSCEEWQEFLGDEPYQATCPQFPRATACKVQSR